MRRAQLSFGDGLIAVEVEDLLEEWMKHAEEVLNDEQLVATVFEALAKRRPKSRSRGRPATPAEVVLRLLILRRVRNWSYNVLEREVRANLVYRKFTHVGAAKMPDAKTMAVGVGRSGHRRSSRCTSELFRLLKPNKWSKGAACEWIRPLLRRTSTIRLTRAFSEMGYAC